MQIANPDRYEEALGILQEECAEVVVEVSKCRRFGLNSIHYKTNIMHRSMLEAEIGDVVAMIDILVEQGIVDKENVAQAVKSKKEKLQKWSKIYEQN
jgi:NTP pyrophosphatase (non-canonical NTP hydrolase)